MEVITRVISTSTEGVDGSEWSCSVLNAQKEGVKSNACFPGRERVYMSMKSIALVGQPMLFLAIGTH